MTEPDLLSLSVAALGEAYRRRTLSPVEVVTTALDRIAATDPVVGAFVHVARDAALSQARAVEQVFREGGEPGPLAGLPVGVKDLVDVAGSPTEAGSSLRTGRLATADAVVVTRLRAAGAVIVGKTRTDEFAYGASTPGTANPWALDRVPGGSSGGSGAAVAARQCIAAIGTDTAGSIRIPAALCGVVGLKPTHGRVPRRGVVPLAWSFDNVGPLGRSVADVAAVFDVIADPPPRAAGRSRLGSAEVPHLPLGAARIGVPDNHVFDDVTPAVAAAVRSALAVLERLGAELVPVTVPEPDLYEAVLYTMLLPEAAAYHAEDFPARAEDYSAQLRKALTIGSTLSAVDYVQAQRVRGVLQQAWRTMFADLDAIVAPTTPMPAVPRDQRFMTWPGGRTESVNSAYVRLCLAGNVTGYPAVSLPCGLDDEGLPLGLQVLAGPHQDRELLELVAVVEDHLAFDHRPPMA